MRDQMEKQTLTQRPVVLVYRGMLLPWSETFIKSQLLALRRWRGILVGNYQLHELALDGANIRVLRGDQSSFLTRFRRKIDLWTSTVPRSITRLLARDNACLLHAHFGVDAIEAFPLARAFNLPMLVTFHGYDINIDRKWWEAGYGGRRMRSYPERLLKLAAQPRVRFIAVSDTIRRRAISFGIPADKISVSYIGIDAASFAQSGPPVHQRARRVLFVGRLVEKKGCEYLIKALSRIQLAVPDVSLTIIGDGELREDLQRLSHRLGVWAIFRGAVSNAEVMQELQRTRVLCLPSVRAANGDLEGLPIALLEAQASGVPVVTSTLGGAAEGIDYGVTGLTFDERDVEGLADRLVRLLTDDVTASSMSLAGPRFIASKFDLVRCTERLESLYDMMISVS